MGALAGVGANSSGGRLVAYFSYFPMLLPIFEIGQYIILAFATSVAVFVTFYKFDKK